jgi:hypothetical protein
LTVAYAYGKARADALAAKVIGPAATDILLE